MNIFFIGSKKKEETDFAEFQSYCTELGQFLSKTNVKILTCSPFSDSVDHFVIKGVTSSDIINVKVELHYPQDPNVETEWDEILSAEEQNKKFSTSRFRHFPVEKNSRKDWKHTWLFCQIQALNNSDLVVAVGGDVNGSSSLLLRIAESQNKTILPISIFGGAGDWFFERNKYELKDKLGKEYFSILEQPKNTISLVKLITDFPNNLFERIKVENEPIYFISYPRARPAEADYVEMILRRRNFTVLRDEKDFLPDKDIPNLIKENIYKADVFVAIWCKEYACSPWCYDELTLALERKRNGKLEIWILCVDDTRMVHPSARRMLFHQVKSRGEIEGKIVSLVNNLSK